MFNPLLVTFTAFSVVAGSFSGALIAQEAAQKVVQEENPNLIVVKEKGFSIEIPKDWLKDKTREGLDLFVYAPVPATERIALANVGVVAGKVGKDLTLSNFYKVNVENLPKSFDSFVELSSGTGGVPEIKSSWITFTRKLKTENGEVELQELQYYMIANDMGYVVTFSATPDEYTQHRGVFEKIISTFKAIKETAPAEPAPEAAPEEAKTEAVPATL